MDVYSTTEARVREYMRKRPSQLDAVIDRAKREAEEAAAAEAAQSASRRARGKLRSLGATAALASVGETKAAASGGAASGSKVAVAADDVARDHGAGRRKEKKKKGKAQRRYTVETRAREQAQVIDGELSTTFGASTKLFVGGRRDVRHYPHELDPHRLRVLMGADLRTSGLNAELRAARERKYDADVRAIAEMENVWELALEQQVDGARLRLGRIATSDQWETSGELHRRGQMWTWKWTPGFYVLVHGMLYEFSGSSLASPIVHAWPVLGAITKHGRASSKAHPFVIELRVASFFEVRIPRVHASNPESSPPEVQTVGWGQYAWLASFSSCRSYPFTLSGRGGPANR